MFVKEPAGHGAHAAADVAPVAPLYDPPLHFVGATAPAGQKAPGGQMPLQKAEDAPFAFENTPAGQGVAAVTHGPGGQ